MTVRVWSGAALLLAVITLITGSLGAATRRSAASPPSDRVIIDLAAGPVARFSPALAFGAVIDGLDQGRVAQAYSPRNIAALKGAGLGATAYNLRTELGIEAWHWTDEGSWSDPSHAQGYWTGSDHPRRAVQTAWGYALPRRGDTTDQAQDDGYSRLDDGDAASFWKSNPYLDRAYSRWPGGDQWVVVHFARATAIDSARISWARPHARRYLLQYWTGRNDTDHFGHWRDFPLGKVTDAPGGTVTIKLSDHPLSARYIRILLQQSAHDAPPGSTDRRDAMGYAIAEVGLGKLDGRGRFHDAVVHSQDGSEQTNIYVSSTDPWHRARDRDPGTEQPGFDRIFGGGLTNGLGVMLNIGALYDTPENTAAQLRFLAARHYPLREVEVGMEPDGQNVPAADFAALFLQSADAIHRVFPHIPLAGPGLQDAKSDTWLVEGASQSWTHLFIAALRRAGRLGDLKDFTFEHYPFDLPCRSPAAMLRGASANLTRGMAHLTADGVPPTMQRSILEYGLSAFSGRVEVEVPEALFNADMIAHFLMLGGHAAYYLGYQPEELFDPEHACAGYGELMLFGQDAQGRATWPTPAYWGMRLMTHEWSQPGNGEHLLYRAGWHGSGAPDQVVAYPVVRPDHRLALLLINRDPARSHISMLQVRRAGSGTPAPLSGPFDVFQYSPQQYQWRAAGADGHPSRDLPPRHYTGRGPITLPPFSLTIVRTIDPQRW